MFSPVTLGKVWWLRTSPDEQHMGDSTTTVYTLWAVVVYCSKKAFDVVMIWNLLNTIKKTRLLADHRCLLYYAIILAPMHPDLSWALTSQHPWHDAYVIFRHNCTCRYPWPHFFSLSTPGRKKKHPSRWVAPGEWVMQLWRKSDRLLFGLGLLLFLTKVKKILVLQRQ